MAAPAAAERACGDCKDFVGESSIVHHSCNDHGPDQGGKGPDRLLAPLGFRTPVRHTFEDAQPRRDAVGDGRADGVGLARYLAAERGKDAPAATVVAMPLR